MGTAIDAWPFERFPNMTGIEEPSEEDVRNINKIVALLRQEARERAGEESA